MSRTRVAVSWSGAFAALVFLGWIGAPHAAAQSGVVVVTGDGACPAGMAPLSVQQAQAQRAALCPQLGQWFIARLEGGGSMDGPGYRCQIRASDPRPLGHTICAPATPRRRPPPPDRPLNVGPGVFDVVPARGPPDVYTLAPDGSATRTRGRRGRGGVWSVQGTSLVIAWGRRDVERFERVGRGEFLGDSGTRISRRLGGPPAPPPPPMPPTPPPARIVVSPGVYDGVHPHWRDTVILAPDGTYRRGSGDPGRWYVEGSDLVLDWQNWGAERLTRTGRDTYRAASNGFTLTLRGGPPPAPPPPALSLTPGTYEGVHPHWNDRVMLFPDGTFRRGNGDPGRWYVQGTELVLDWQNWGAARLRATGPGAFRGSDGFTLTFRTPRLPTR